MLLLGREMEGIRTVPPYFEPLVGHVVDAVADQCPPPLLTPMPTSPWRAGGTSRAPWRASWRTVRSGPWGDCGGLLLLRIEDPLWGLRQACTGM